MVAGLFGSSAVTTPVQAPSAWEQKGKAKGKGIGTPRDHALSQEGKGKAQGKGLNAAHDTALPLQGKGQAQGKDAGAKGEHAGSIGPVKGNKGGKPKAKARLQADGAGTGSDLRVLLAPLVQLQGGAAGRRIGKPSGGSLERGT